MAAPSSQYGVETLEEQIRRMAMSSGAPQGGSPGTSQPVVRLPPTAQHGAQQPGSQSLHTGSQYYGQKPPHSATTGAFVQQQSPRPNFMPHPPGQRNEPPGSSANLIHHGSVDSPTPFRGRTMHNRGGFSQRQGQRQQFQIDPDAYNRRPQPRHGALPAHSAQNLYNPQSASARDRPNWRDVRTRQIRYLDEVANKEVPLVEMGESERSEKEGFRQILEKICHEVCRANPQRIPQVSLECFGSFQSGFASAGSDMDLVIVVKVKESESACFSLMEDDLPRALEKRLLQEGFGARLLSRTRVPIIKLCEKPGVSLLDKLREEREKWDDLPNEKKYPHLFPEEEEPGDDDVHPGRAKDQDATAPTTPARKESDVGGVSSPIQAPASDVVTPGGTEPKSNPDKPITANPAVNGSQQARARPWTRERKAGPLDFPKSGVGIQSDINFFNPLGLHNTQMLRCYSFCDDRVRPMILFVKAWVKRRKINSSYSGTLSSYGYVLMVLHYLTNVARPPVLPNLQQPWRPNPDCTPQGATAAMVDGWAVDFWRNEDEIWRARQAGQMTTNTESLGSLLAGFLQYYSSLGGGVQFRWTTQVLSLRTPGGILSKEEKGWVKATTEEGEGKRIQHRYLFCIEDPFELNHNVARTVTHNGIVAIRDEFRRAYGILNAIGNGMFAPQGDLFDELVQPPEARVLPPDLQDKPTDGPKTEYPMVQPAEFGQAHHQPSQSRRSKSNQTRGASTPKGLDVSSNEAFPALKAAKAQPQGRSGEISGERAKAFLEELKRKKAESSSTTS